MSHGDIHASNSGPHCASVSNTPSDPTICDTTTYGNDDYPPYINLHTCAHTHHRAANLHGVTGTDSDTNGNPAYANRDRGTAATGHRLVNLRLGDGDHAQYLRLGTSVSAHRAG